jgi:hypothetical protein
MSRQTLTYERLSELMYKRKAAGVLAAILGHVAFYCEDAGLPPLTVLVVEKDSGRPSFGIPVQPTKIDEVRERVFQHDWYNDYPPSEQALAIAHEHHSRKAKPGIA